MSLILLLALSLFFFLSLSLYGMTLLIIMVDSRHNLRVRAIMHRRRFEIRRKLDSARLISVLPIRIAVFGHLERSRSVCNVSVLPFEVYQRHGLKLTEGFMHVMKF